MNKILIIIGSFLIIWAMISNIMMGSDSDISMAEGTPIGDPLEELQQMMEVFLMAGVGLIVLGGATSKDGGGGLTHARTLTFKGSGYTDFEEILYFLRSLREDLELSGKNITQSTTLKKPIMEPIPPPSPPHTEASKTERDLDSSMWSPGPVVPPPPPPDPEPPDVSREKEKEDNGNEEDNEPSDSGNTMVISCPGCEFQFRIPKGDELQVICCPNCGLEGEMND